ncbi:MAG: hypothetical protein ABI180_17030 [Microcoleus sp.]|jgi:hypothetical protein
MVAYSNIGMDAMRAIACQAIARMTVRHALIREETRYFNYPSLSLLSPRLKTPV